MRQAVGAGRAKAAADVRAETNGRGAYKRWRGTVMKKPSGFGSGLFLFFRVRRRLCNEADWSSRF